MAKSVNMYKSKLDPDWKLINKIKEKKYTVFIEKIAS
jgi:hypothetical protein